MKRTRRRERERERKRESKLEVITSSEIFHPETFKFLLNCKKKYEKEGGKWTIYSPLKSFPQIVNNDGYPVISKQLAQKVSHIRNTKNHKKYIRASFGLDGIDFSNIPLMYVHFLDKKFVTYKISHKCCDFIKGRVKHDKRPSIIGTTISESRLRKSSWINHGCNIYDKNKSVCRPISLWTENDVWEYIKINNIKVSNIYKQGFIRSGCVVCMFGLSLERHLSNKNKEYKNRFELLYENNRNIFNAFVMSDNIGLWKPITDMWIKLNIDDEAYIKKYKKRHKELINWYKNFDENFNKVLDEIESRNPNVWNKNERKQIFKKYKKSQAMIERMNKYE